MYSNQKTILSPKEVDKLLDEYPFIKSNKGISYMNVPVAFDIETTSFYNEKGEKSSIMYAWVFGINGLCIIGRTWDEFMLVLQRIKERYSLRDNKRILIYVHNLAFEFSYLSKLFEWDNVFATDERKPVYAVSGGIEFRCSYILSGYSLAMVGKNLVKYKVEKMVGDLDYSLIRHSKTPLTEKEYGYILNDALVVMSYIAELIEEFGDLHKIPLTQTGFVRKYVRRECLYGGIKNHRNYNSAKQYKKYRDLMSTLLIPSYPTYLQLKANYTGGFTHCNALYNGVVIEDVTSFDFTSSYP